MQVRRGYGYPHRLGSAVSGSGGAAEPGRRPLLRPGGCDRGAGALTVGGERRRGADTTGATHRAGVLLARPAGAVQQRGATARRPAGSLQRRRY